MSPGKTDSSFDEKLVRRYSPAVMKRLLGYLSPYRLAAVSALAALAVATIAELLLPVVVQRTLDENILKRYSRLSLLQVEISDLISRENTDNLLGNGVQAGENLFVPTGDLSFLNESQKAEAESIGLLFPEEWYVFYNDSPEVSSVVNRHNKIFLGWKTDNTNSPLAISVPDFAKLTPQEKRIIRSRDISGLRFRSLQYLLLLTIVLLFTFVQVYLASWIGQKVMADIRIGLLSHIMRQSLRYLGKTPVGSLVSRVANDVETINEFFTNVATSFLKDGAMMIGVVVVIFLLDVKLALISMASLIPTAILIIVFRNRMREAFRKVRTRVSAVNTYLSERIGGMQTVHLFAAENRSRNEFSEKSRSLLGAEISEMKIMAVFRPLVDMISSVIAGAVIWYSSGLQDQGLVTLGVLVAFIELIQKFFQPVRDIAEKFNILQSAMAGSERIFDMMDEVDRIPDAGTDVGECSDSNPEAEDSELSCGEIRFENVQFSYVPGERIFNDLSFVIHPGETVAIVGATGAGKTTIANLLTRLWDVDGGRILLDGEDIRNRPLEVLRKTVQPVQQDVFLFSGSISDNIDLGLDISSEKIMEAAMISRAEAFIQTLPEGFDTQITEGAGNLSAGQRQLIAFARIIAHNPRIIILDEATANVDTATESLLQEGLDVLLQDRTALIIAHRLSTIRRADRILVLGHRKLIEEGTHDELMANKGTYHKLYTLQFSEIAGRT